MLPKISFLGALIKNTHQKKSCHLRIFLFGDILNLTYKKQGAAKGSLLVTTLKKLATVGCEGLDVPKRYWRELRGDELGGEGIFGVEGIYVNQTIVDLSHCRIGCRWGVGVRARKR